MHLPFLCHIASSLLHQFALHATASRHRMGPLRMSQGVHGWGVAPTNSWPTTFHTSHDAYYWSRSLGRGIYLWFSCGPMHAIKWWHLHHQPPLSLILLAINTWLCVVSTLNSISVVCSLGFHIESWFINISLPLPRLERFNKKEKTVTKRCTNEGSSSRGKWMIPPAYGSSANLSIHYTIYGT